MTDDGDDFSNQPFEELAAKEVHDVSAAAAQPGAPSSQVGQVRERA